MEIKRNWLLIGALALTVVGCSGDDDDADKDNADGSGGVAGSSPGSGGVSSATTTKVGPSTVASGGIATAGKGVGGSLVSTGGSSMSPGAAGVPVAPGSGGQSGHAGEPPRGSAGSVSASGGASSVAGARAVAGAAGNVATNGCGRVRYSNLDATGATTDAVQDVLDTLDDRLLVCNQQEFARDDASEAQFTLRIVIDEDGDATTTIRNRTDASNAFFDCILPVYRSADWSDLRRLEEVSATVRFRTGDC